MKNLLEKIYGKYIWLVVIIWLIAIAAFVFRLGGMLETNQFERTIDNQQTQSNRAVQEAANAQNAAVNASIERRSEDAAREKVILPKLGEARRKSQNSKAELEAARKNHHDKKTDTSNLSRSNADNCRELSGLFPDISFEDCQ